MPAVYYFCEVTIMKRTNYASGAPLEEKIGYSRVVKTGPFIEVGGTTSVQPDKSVFAEHETYGQVKYVLEKQVRLVEEAGGSRDDIYRITVFCTPEYKADEGMKAVGEVLGGVKPVCSIMPIHHLVRPTQVVEIEMSACIGCGAGTEWEGMPLKKESISYEDPALASISEAVKVGPFVYAAAHTVHDLDLPNVLENPDAQDDLIYKTVTDRLARWGVFPSDVVDITSLAAYGYRKHRGQIEYSFYKRVFKPVKPLHTVLYVPALFKKGQLVQHEIFAIKGCGGDEKLPEWGNFDLRRENISSGSPLEDTVGYSRIVKCGPFFYCGGTTSVLPDGSVACEDDSRGQESFIIKKLMDLMAPYGIRPVDVTKVQSFRVPRYKDCLTDDPGLYGEILKPVKPLLTGLFIGGLTRPAQLLEFRMNVVAGLSMDEE